VFEGGRNILPRTTRFSPLDFFIGSTACKHALNGERGSNHSDRPVPIITITADSSDGSTRTIGPSGFLTNKVENFEPEVALRGGKVDGMQVPKLFIEAAARLLKPDGILIMEHHENQSELIKQALKEEFRLPQTHADLTGRDRFTSARRR
jgi:hypothetical protein